MKSLSQKQRKHLKGLAHHLDPVVTIGKHGITEPVIREIELTLDAHELIKIRLISDDRDERRDQLAKLSALTDSHLVQVIGKLGVFYRTSDEPSIVLP